MEILNGLGAAVRNSTYITQLPSSKAIINYNNLKDMIRIWVCSVITLFGVIGNMVSFIVFIQSGRRNPRIVTRNLLLLLTITNSTYLILYWVHRILPELVLGKSIGIYNPTNSTNATIFDYILTNRNKYSCRVVNYLINVAIILNATVSVSFSVERAIAINFPFATRDLRENYKQFFKYMIIAIILFSFVFPVYNLQILHITNKNKCDVYKDYQELYFALTIILVVITLLIPFLLITVSNISVLIAIYQSNRKLVERMGSWSDSGSVPATTHLTNGNGNVIQDESATKSLLKKHERYSIRESFRKFTSLGSKKNKCGNKFSTGSAGSNGRKGRDKNSKITTMLLAISVSFVLLNFPYFIAWCNNAYTRIYRKNETQNMTSPTNLTNSRQNNSPLTFLKITEVLNLLNYAINGFLYFSTGKLYREHLFYLFRCKYSKPSLGL